MLVDPQLFGGQLIIQLKYKEAHLVYRTAEAQKPGWQGGIATRKVFARPESFCAQPLKLHWEVSGPFGKFPDSLDIFQIAWKVSG